MQLDFEVILVSDGVTVMDDIILEVTLMKTRLFFADVRRTEELILELNKAVAMGMGP